MPIAPPLTAATVVSVLIAVIARAENPKRRVYFCAYLYVLLLLLLLLWDGPWSLRPMSRLAKSVPLANLYYHLNQSDSDRLRLVGKICPGSREPGRHLKCQPQPD